MRKILFTALLLPLLIACSRNGSADPVIQPVVPPPATAATCKLAKSYSWSVGGYLVDSGTYSYNSSGLLTQVATRNTTATFTWSGSNISMKNIVQGTQASTERFAYYPDGSLMTRWMQVGVGTSFITTDSMSFSYTNGKITGLRNYRYSSNGLALENECTYTYTGNNITQATETDYYYTTPQTTVTNLVYDNLPNYLLRADPRLAIISPQWIDIDPQYYPFVLSANNIIRAQGINPATGTDFIYPTDATGNLSTWKGGNITLATFKYQCP